MKTASILLCLFVASASADDELRVLQSKEGEPALDKMLYSYLAGQAHTALDRRREEYEKLKTPEQCAAYQERMREFFLKQLGGFPERTPLNAQVVGKLEGDDYRVEKIIYESRPNHHVTAALYLPSSKPPYPAVLIACGHSKTGKAAGYNQRMGILLAKNGLAAMCYDPIGQGERSQSLSVQDKPEHGSTTEHFLIGVGSLLLGTNTAQYRIWDGIRGIDYLASRKDIDGKRIGCTGCSGGGTLTSYIMALDERVACAAPACYLTTWRRLIDTNGPQDSEQNIFGQVAFGMDHPDYILMRAPKPTLICATTHDFFDIQGTWDCFRQAKRIYARYGYPERVDLIEADGKHGVMKVSREALTRWMRRWLLKIDDAITETEPELWTEEQLRCTPKGQVLLLPDERSVYDINIDLDKQLAMDRDKFWSKTSDDDARKTIRQLTRIRPLDELPKPKIRQVGMIQKEKHQLHKFVIQPEPGISLPAITFVPEKTSGEVYLYLTSFGISADITQESVADLIKKGHQVTAVDLRGLGETRSGRANKQFGDWKNFYMSYLLGKSLVGMRTEDVLVCARQLAKDLDRDKLRPIHVVGQFECCLPVLHAAALQPELFKSVRVWVMADSWSQVVRSKDLIGGQFDNVIHGALKIYDLSNLVSLAGKDRVKVEWTP